MRAVGTNGLPLIGGIIAAITFAFLRPSLTDRWFEGRVGQLEWAALGAVLAGLGLLVVLRLWQARRVVAAVVAAALTVAICALCLRFPEDVDRLATTIFTVTVAIGIIGSCWVMLNVLVSSSGGDWRRFCALSAALVGATFFALLRGNLSVTALVAEPDLALYGAGAGWLGRIEWPIFGALVWGVAGFVSRTFQNRAGRVLVASAAGLMSGWFIGTHSLAWQRPTIEFVPIMASMAICICIAVAWAARPGRRRDSSQQLVDFVPAALVGAAIGFVIGTWLLAPFAGSETNTVVAAAVPLALLGARFGWNPDPSYSSRAAFETRAQGALFLGPALLFLTAALIIPAVRTIFLSTLDRNFNSRSFEGNTFDGLNAQGDAFIGLDNYRTLWNDIDSFDLSKWQNMFTSQLFWIALALIVTGVLVGLVAGTRQNGEPSFVGSGSSWASIGFGGLLLAFAAFSVLRGTFFNNLWWVVTVTTVSVVLGLTIAVLAERAGRFESVAKSLIFMPMAISFVGASIVWRLQYQPRDPTKSQTGVLNAVWVQLGRLSHSGLPRTLCLVALGVLLAFMLWRTARRVTAGETFGAWVGGLIVVAYLLIELARRSLGGFQFGANGQLLPDTVVFLQEPPFNNVFLMVILIWIQTGFAMVILSAAIKAVPPELIEAARVDGATDSQTFFQVTLPQIMPTVGVVATTLIVLVTKVFDIVKVSTGGNFGTNVLANDMYEVSFSFANFTLGSAIAVFILLSVLPVMFINVRRMQKARMA